MKAKQRNLLPLVIVGLIVLAGLAYFAKPENREKIGVEQKPEETQVDWNALLPEMKNILKAKSEGAVDESQISILSTPDLTGDGLTEAVINSGEGGAYTMGVVVFRAEGGKPVLATIRMESGEMRDADFAEGASAMNGVSFKPVPEKKAIFSAMYTVDGRTADISLESCKGDAYVWNEREKLFAWNSALSGEMQRSYCEEVEGKIKSSSSVEYRNTQYGFVLTLPISWTGYSLASGQWQGFEETPSGNIQKSGPMVTVRHPNWTATRQEIPVMVFTLAEWSKMRSDLNNTGSLYVGAAPIPPSELGRNSKYVFALPARYNFGFVSGIEEVQRIIESKPLRGI